MGQLREVHDTLIFLHIPKTAGTTFSFILTRHFEEQDIYHIRNLQQMLGPAYSKHFGSVDHFEDLDEDERNRFHCIIGHAPFGLHRHLSRPVQYITFLRDPVKRVISQYHQNQRMIKANELDDDPVTLEQFIESMSPNIHNLQTHFISGLDLNSHSPEECYEKALAHINKYFSLIGIVERFDESLLLLSKIFSWTNITYTKRNTTARKDSLTNIDPSTIQMIRDANQLDTKLYQHAVTLLDEKIRSQGKRFNRDLRIFRRKQSLKAARHILTSLPHFMVRQLSHVGKLSRQ